MPLSWKLFSVPDLLKRFLSARGDLVADARTNTLIITDVQDGINRVDNLIRGLDKKTQQVEIEARIVAASRSFARDIGTQLAASGLSGNMVLGGAGIVGTSASIRSRKPPCPGKRLPLSLTPATRLSSDS